MVIIKSPGSDDSRVNQQENEGKIVIQRVMARM